MRLLLVDDHPLFLEGFAAMIGRLRPDWTLGQAASGDEAIAALQRDPADVALVDVFLPGRDGFDLLHDLKARWASLPVILISGRDHATMEVRARSSPACGFVPKTTDGATFVALIETAVAGGQAFPGRAGDVVAPALTGRQAQVLALLAEGHGNKEIRYRLGIAERTVRAHLTDIFQMLGVHGRMPAVIRARALGLIE